MSVGRGVAGGGIGVLVVVLLALFSLAYLFFLNRVNRKYGVK